MQHMITNVIASNPTQATRHLDAQWKFSSCHQHTNGFYIVENLAAACHEIKTSQQAQIIVIHTKKGVIQNLGAELLDCIQSLIAEEATTLHQSSCCHAVKLK